MTDRLDRVESILGAIADRLDRTESRLERTEAIVNSNARAILGEPFTDDPDVDINPA